MIKVFYKRPKKRIRDALPTSESNIKYAIFCAVKFFTQTLEESLLHSAFSELCFSHRGAKISLLAFFDTDLRKKMHPKVNFVRTGPFHLVSGADGHKEAFGHSLSLEYWMKRKPISHGSSKEK